MEPRGGSAIRRGAGALGGSLALLPLAGCGTTANPPAIALFGSYFPAWIACAVIGILFAVVLRIVLVRLDLSGELPAAPLVYLCAAILGGTMSWLLWTGAA